MDRKRSIDTTSGGSDVTVIEGIVPDEAVDVDKIDDSGQEKVSGAKSDSENDKPRFDSTSKSIQVITQKSNYDSTSKPTELPTQLPSCLFRRDSERASIKKKVRCSETTEVIPESHYFVNSEDWCEVPHEDDDDVFSDFAPIQTPRGNMCTPYVERKGSLPGLEGLPDWFPNSRLISHSPEINLFLSFVSCCSIYLSVGGSFVGITQFSVYSFVQIPSRRHLHGHCQLLCCWLIMGEIEFLLNLLFVSFFMLTIIQSLRAL